MKTLSTIWIVVAGLLLIVSFAMAKETPAILVGDAAGWVIGSEAHCVNSRGIPIKEAPDNQVKAACLRDQNVRWACNPDGSHARVEAFRDWSGQLMDFKDRCSSVGGVFGFADPTFQEPADSSFCGLAQPVVTYSEFETPMCNFVSRCPRIAVTCTKTEEAIAGSMRTVQLPGIPRPVAIPH